MLQILKGSASSRILLIGVIILTMFIAGCGDKEDDTVVASYTGGEITKSELDKFNSIFFGQYDYSEDPEARQYFLEQLAMLKILSSRATDEIRQEAGEEAKSQVEQMEAAINYQEQGAFDQQLRELNISKTDLEDFFTMSSVILKSMNDSITEQQLEQSYNERLAEDPLAFTVASVAHILISIADPTDTTGTAQLRTPDEALARANEVKDKLDDGGDFAQLASEYSDDPGSSQNGGVYANENLANSMWEPIFRQAAIDQPVGETGEPFEGYWGYHIMRVDKRESLPLSEVEDELRNILADQKINDFLENELETLEFEVHAE